MKKTMIAAISLLTLAGSAQAGQLVTVDCSLSTLGRSITHSMDLRSGMREKVVCERFGCPDKKEWAITLNYNGNSYEDISLEVTHKPSKQTTLVKFPDIKAGSMMEFTTYNMASRRSLGMICDVRAVQ